MASQHEAASDPCNGADVYHIVLEQQKLQPDDDGDQWALNVVVTSGGQWHRERIKAAGYRLPDTTCQRCFRASEKLFHRIWECGANVGHRDFTHSQFLFEQARVNHESCPSCWL